MRNEKTLENSNIKGLVTALKLSKLIFNGRLVPCLLLDIETD